MRAIQMTEHGGPDVLRLTDAPDPQPGPGEVAVELAAAGVNFRDVYERQGVYPKELPAVPGAEGAGRVTAVGDGVTDVRVGDVVASAEFRGAYAERAVAPADRVVPVPDGVAPDLAAAVLLQGLTAHYLTHSTYEIKPGDTALVHAAAGGMGLLLTQMIKLRGGRVIGTVSTDEKEKLARDAGADEVLRYDGFADEVRRRTGGVPVVYDGVGKTTFDGSLASLRRRGLLALYGAASGPVPPLDPQRLNSGGSLFLTRPTLGDYVATREELLWRADDLFGWIASGELSVHVGGRYPLADTGRAHEDLEARRTTGKLLLIP
ncbi:quinone oxidoreductase family protein [Actinoallomurus rhizosphaericola]|uniref:quinone oxidoreductase family protein n=1 Tax=Actinoallomurus rhizosphaericola TaxID=2952536 RepID=UPI0020932B31|nr:quinone oxidoreductase [Actinoallomurus rhizosphaericola]MCO5998855.1 quinone oxidoreductase [Actinoallomurus rhizosphaericola]